MVIGNGAEGEPLSRKDAELLSRRRTSCLDGLAAVAAAVSADRVVHLRPAPRGVCGRNRSATNGDRRESIAVG